MTDEVLLRTPDSLVRILKLDPGGTTPWHWHTEVDDQMVCLEGLVCLEMSDPDEAVELHVGQLVKVGHLRRHRVFNGGETVSRYPLIQGPGKYDFNEE
jgi:mannose-6-phosphate isomerase-like protein (cupin superfamily)